MSTYTEFTKQLTDQIVDALESAAQTATDSQRRFVDGVSQSVPTAFASVEKFSTAVTDSLPAPTEIIQANFDFANRVLTAQRDSALRILDIVTSATDKAAPTKTAADA